MDRPGVLVCAMADDSIYTTDIYAWAMAQARALRDPSRRANAIGWDNVAEEIESGGISQFRACESALERILKHFLKIEYLRLAEPVRHWRREIANFRLDLERDSSPTIASALSADLAKPYSRARRRLLADLAAREETPPGDLPPDNSYAWDDVLGRGGDWTPDPRPPLG